PERRAFLSSLRVQDMNGPIIGREGEVLTIRAERHFSRYIRQVLHAEQGLSRLGLPGLQLAPTHTPFWGYGHVREAPAVRTEGQMLGPAGRGFQRMHSFQRAGSDVPERHGNGISKTIFDLGERQPLPIWAECGDPLPRVAQAPSGQLLDLLPRG